MFYVATLHLDAPGIGFTIDDLPGFAAHYEGDDMDKAVKVAENVLRDYLDVMHGIGQAIPKARAITQVVNADRQAGLTGQTYYSLQAFMPVPKPRRVNLSMDENELAMIDRKAELAGLTRSAFLVMAADHCGDTGNIQKQ